MKLDFKNEQNDNGFNAKFFNSKQPTRHEGNGASTGFIGQIEKESECFRDLFKAKSQDLTLIYVCSLFTLNKIQ